MMPVEEPIDSDDDELVLDPFGEPDDTGGGDDDE